MSYRSKRAMSAALAEDASGRAKRPMLVSQSPTTGTTPMPTLSQTEEKPMESNPSIQVIPTKSTSASPHMPSFSSKGESKWGPFTPPGNGVPTTLPPSFGTKGVAGSKSIWKTPPAPLNPKQMTTLNPKSPQISTPKPMATQPWVTSKSSSSGDKNPSIPQKDFDRRTPSHPYTHEGVNEVGAKQSISNTRTKSHMLSSAHNLPENQLHKASSTTTLPHTNTPAETVKSPHHVGAEMLQTTTRNKLHAVGDTKPMEQESASHTKPNQQEIKVTSRENKSKKTMKSMSFKTRLPFSIPGWPEDVEFDPKDEVLTIGANGEYHAVSGNITAIDVLSSKSVKYIVEFNKNYQPLKKGGWVLVKFLGYLAKMGEFCPVGASNWHAVENHLKVKIINRMREHFVIPREEIYDKLALQRVSKSWRHYKHELKKACFQPLKKTHVQHYDPVPGGIAPNEWIKLVDYWFSEKGQKLSQIGKEARSQHCQAHTLGSNSYANLRADYEEEHGEEMGLIECWEKSHKRKDGTFVKDTVTEDFLIDAKARVEALKMFTPSTSHVDLEDRAFHDVLNGGEIPERPQGFGFGVKKSDVYGVHGLLRKNDSGKAEVKHVDLDVNARYAALNKRNEELEKSNKELSTKYDKNNKMMNTIVAQFSQILNAMRTGKATRQLFDAAQSALELANQEVNDDDDACDDGVSNEKEAGPSK